MLVFTYFKRLKLVLKRRLAVGLGRGGGGGGGGVGVGPVDEVGEGADVGLRHLQRLILGQLVIAAQIGDDLAQPLERVVEAVHAAPLACVGGDPPPLQHRRRRRPGTSEIQQLAQHVQPEETFRPFKGQFYTFDVKYLLS